MLFAAKVWHYWVGVVLFFGTLAPIVMLLINYLVKVQAPQYERRTRRTSGEQHKP
jgi:formate-dependent nitrite reductase membrane component NrfD